MKPAGKAEAIPVRRGDNPLSIFLNCITLPEIKG